MNIKDFDFNIQEHIVKLLKIAEQRYPNRQWFINVCYWQDNTFRVLVENTQKDDTDVIKYKFFYKKSSDKYVLLITEEVKVPYKERVDTANIVYKENMLSEEELMI